MKRRLVRRSFLKLSALTLGSLSTPSLLRASSRLRHVIRRTAPKKVIVVGGGLAGLAAAWELHATGHQVTLLEAKTRSGGRVLTIRAPFADSLFAEAGGTRISDQDRLVFGYVREFGLALAPYRPQVGDDVLLLRGRRIRILRADPPGLDQYPLELTDGERELGPEGLEARLLEEEPLKEIEEGGEELDRLSFGEFVRGLGFSEDVAPLLRLGHENPASVSALWVLRRMVRARKEQLKFKIIGGNSLLATRFADRLQERSRYGSPVVKVERIEGAVRAVFLEGGRPASVEADRLICAVPFPVLDKIEFVPQLSGEKLDAIRALGRAGGTRILVQTRRPYWFEQGYSGFARTDDPAELLSPTHDALARREILDVWLKGGASTSAASMSGEERLEHGMELIERIYPGIRGEAEGGVSRAWDTDPWVGGAHALPGPGWLSGKLDAAVRAEGRVHFAGEHTSPMSGTMEGALESGIRAAREVNDIVADPLGA